MAKNVVKLTEYKLTTKLLAQIIPPSWVCPFHMMELHLKETVEDILNKNYSLLKISIKNQSHIIKNMGKESSLITHATSIKVVMNGMTAEKTQRIKEIMTDEPRK